MSCSQSFLALRNSLTPLPSERRSGTFSHRTTKVHQKIKMIATAKVSNEMGNESHKSYVGEEQQLFVGYGMRYKIRAQLPKSFWFRLIDRLDPLQKSHEVGEFGSVCDFSLELSLRSV